MTTRGVAKAGGQDVKHGGNELPMLLLMRFQSGWLVENGSQSLKWIFFQSAGSRTSLHPTLFTLDELRLQ